jgi:hypothetical protein
VACACATVCLCPQRFAGAGRDPRWARAVDRARGIIADLGLRPYRVSFVHARWTGARRGDGVEEVITQREILPVPLVQDMAGIARQLSLAQIDESGSVLITKISAGYTEDQVLCRPGTGKPLPPNEVIYYEIQALEGGERRRFVPVGGAAPSLKAAGGWSVTVTLQAGARPRSGVNR